MKYLKTVDRLVGNLHEQLVCAPVNSILFVIEQIIIDRLGE